MEPVALPRTYPDGEPCGGTASGGLDDLRAVALDPGDGTPQAHRAAAGIAARSSTAARWRSSSCRPTSTPAPAPTMAIAATTHAVANESCVARSPKPTGPR